MFDHLDRPLVPSGLASVLAHAGAVAALLFGTFPPRHTADAARPPLLISWPQAPESRGDPLEGVAGPTAPPVNLPSPTPIDVPPIDARIHFDGRALLQKASGVAQGGGEVEGDRPWSMEAVEDPPVLLAGPPLAYPEALRRAGIVGRVVVQAVIDTLGRVEPASVAMETTVAGLASPARVYALGARFRPARVNGRAVRVLVRLPLEFTLAARRSPP
jgi:TonB family protein